MRLTLLLTCQTNEELALHYQRFRGWCQRACWLRYTTTQATGVFTEKSRFNVADTSLISPNGRYQSQTTSINRTGRLVSLCAFQQCLVLRMITRLLCVEILGKSTSCIFSTALKFYVDLKITFTRKQFGCAVHAGYVNGLVGQSADVSSLNIIISRSRCE